VRPELMASLHLSEGISINLMKTKALTIGRRVDLGLTSHCFLQQFITEMLQRRAWMEINPQIIRIGVLLF
jgi:hypothetical protein